MGVKGTLIKAAELGYITEVRCGMPKCFCPEELGGASHFVARTQTWNDWEPTHEHFPIPKREGGKATPDNTILAHRLCNKFDYFISHGLSIEKDLARVESAREAAAAASLSPSAPAAEAVADALAPEPASPLVKSPRKRKAAAWKSLPPAELAAHLLSTPTIADSAWTTEPRLPRETREYFIRRIVLGETPESATEEAAAESSRLLDEAGVIAYDDSLPTEERGKRLQQLLTEKPWMDGSVAGYMEMLSMQRMGHEDEALGHWAAASRGALPVFLRWALHRDALDRAEESGALQEVEAALRDAYAKTEYGPRRLRPSSVVEDELKNRGWKKRFVPAPEGLNAKDSFDGWKWFPESELAVAVEVEWPWERVLGDLVKFWRAHRAEDIDIGIEVLRGPDAFDYVVHHVYGLCRELIPDLRVVFCALHAPDLHDPFPTQPPVAPRY